MGTKALASWTRRRAGLSLGGLAAGLLGAAMGKSAESKKKKKKKKCPRINRCPLACCSCGAPLNICVNLRSTTIQDADAECQAACAGAGSFSFLAGTPGVDSARCTPGNTCEFVRCPVV